LQKRVCVDKVQGREEAANAWKWYSHPLPTFLCLHAHTDVHPNVFGCAYQCAQLSWQFFPLNIWETQV
jgi:hypothetical protein